jgi:hypothetical protein
MYLTCTAPQTLSRWLPSLFSQIWRLQKLALQAMLRHLQTLLQIFQKYLGESKGV